MNTITYLLQQPQLYIPFLLWSLIWKGSALWKAANKRQLLWFILLLVINTMGLFEILYIFFLNRWDIDNGKILSLLEKKRKHTSK